MEIHPHTDAISNSYDEFRERQVAEAVRPAFDEIREFCNSLGDDVIEQIRPHRMVFCKSMNMRWFADAKPDGPGAFIVKINKGWREPIQSVHVDKDGELQDLKSAITTAYAEVR